MNDALTRILVVDDIETNRIILKEILSDTYEIEQAQNGIEAISNLVNSSIKPNLILLDVMMPELDGFGVISFMKADPVLNKIPVIFITASNQEIQGLRAGAMDYISKPFEPEIVRLRVANQIELTQYREKLEGLVDQKANELLVTREHFLDTMANLIEYRSLESGQHVKRTRELARLLVLQLLRSGGPYGKELQENAPTALVKAVPLHDIGKIGIPDNILLKPGRLNKEEFQIIESHSIIGGKVIQSLIEVGEDEYLKHCYNICRYHHERWDGRGYPDKLKGAEIPLSARIVAVVDVYDALVSERCYKKAIPHKDAVSIIKEGSGNQFDPKIVETLLEVEDKFIECARNC
ncbi:MAG: response regulator [Firmicutes bacterium]|nr:response regulator [Bacillota bacterium]